MQLEHEWRWPFTGNRLASEHLQMCNEINILLILPLYIQEKRKVLEQMFLNFLSDSCIRFLPKTHKGLKAETKLLGVKTEHGLTGKQSSYLQSLYSYS